MTTPLMNMTAEDWKRIDDNMAAELRKNPFTQFTIWDDTQARRAVLNAIVAQSSEGPRSYGRRGWSPIQKMAAQGNAVNRGDRALYNAARQALMRQKRAAADIAEKFSPEAATEIRALPDMPEWSEK